MQCVLNDLAQGLNEPRRIIQAGAHFELREPQALSLVARLVIDLGQGLHMIGNEGYGHDANFADLLGSKLLQGVMQGRLQPFACPNLALVAEAVRISPSAALRQQADGFFNLALVRIALVDNRHGHAVCAENNFRPLRSGEAREGLVDPFDHRIKIHRITIESLYAVNRQVILKEAIPLVQARSGGG